MENNSTSNKWWIGYSVLTTIIILGFYWVNRIHDPEHIILDLLPHVIYGIIIFGILAFVPNRTTKILNQILGNQEIFKQRSNAEKNLTLDSFFARIEKSRDTFISNYKPLETLIDKIIEEQIVEIENLSTGKPKFKTEQQREAFIDYLFDYLDTIPDLIKIQSLTWDYQDYFSDYWKTLVKVERLLSRNEKARVVGIQIERLFIFPKKSFDEQKRRVFDELRHQNSRNRNAQIKWLYEEDLQDESLHDYIADRSSFLLLIDKNNHVKIMTENFQPENEADDKPSEGKFFINNTSTIQPQLRFNKLWSLKERDNYD